MVQIAMFQVSTGRAPPWKHSTSMSVESNKLRKCFVFSVTMETKGRTKMHFFLFSADCLIKRISATEVLDVKGQGMMPIVFPAEVGASS